MKKKDQTVPAVLETVLDRSTLKATKERWLLFGIRGGSQVAIITSKGKLNVLEVVVDELEPTESGRMSTVSVALVEELESLLVERDELQERITGLCKKFHKEQGFKKK